MSSCCLTECLCSFLARDLGFRPISPCGTAAGYIWRMRLKIALLLLSLSFFLSPFFLPLDVNLRFANMSSRYSHIASLMETGSNAHLKPSAVSSTTPINSHFHDLRQLEPEEDLIELDSEPPTPQIKTEHLDVPVHRSSKNRHGSDHGLKRHQGK